jgi:hypothetical protein
MASTAQVQTDVNNYLSQPATWTDPVSGQVVINSAQASVQSQKQQIASLQSAINTINSKLLIPLLNIL